MHVIGTAGSENLPAIIIFYLMLGVLAPFCEEIMFRGFLYGALRAKLGSRLATVASAALFALLHFDRGGLLMLFAIGLVLAAVYERTRALVPAMVAHALWNCGSFTFALIMFGGR
jgi:uncharacterized protein